MRMIQEQKSSTVTFFFFFRKPQEKSGDKSFFWPLIEKFFSRNLGVPSDISYLSNGLT